MAAPQPGPLQGRTILVAASADKAALLAGELATRGARVETIATIALRPLASPALDAAVDALAGYDWVIFTSSHGVDHFLRRLSERGGGPARFAALRVCAVGPATARALREAAVPVHLVPEEYRAEGVLSALERVQGPAGLAGLGVLLPGPVQRRDRLAAALAAAGARVDAVACYENVLPDLDPQSLAIIRASSPEVVLFTSGSAARNLASLLGDDVTRLCARATVAAIGPVTAGVLRDLGLPPDVVAPESTLAGLAGALEAHFAARGASQGAGDD